MAEILEPDDELREKLHPYALRRLEQWRSEVKQEIPQLEGLGLEELNADVTRYLEDGERAAIQNCRDNILKWVMSCVGASSSPYSPIYAISVTSSMFNLKWLLKKVYDRKAKEAEEDQERKAAYEALDVPQKDAKKYLGKEEYAEFADSIPGAIDAYLTEGKHYAMDRRALPYLIVVARIKSLRRQDEAKSIATRQASRFNKELNEAMEKLKVKLYAEKQNPSRYFKEKRPVSQKLYSCLSLAQRQYVSQKVEEIVQEELKTLVFEPYRDFLKWEDGHYFRLSPKADYVFDSVPCLAFSFEIEAVVESEVWLIPASKIFGGYRFTLPLVDRGSYRLELQRPERLGFRYHYLSPAELPAIAWQNIPLALLAGLTRGETEPPGVTVVEASQSTVNYKIKNFEEEVVIPAVFADFLKTVERIERMVSMGIMTQEVADIVHRKLTGAEAAPVRRTSESKETRSYSAEEFISEMARLSYSRKDSEILLKHVPEDLALDEALRWSLEHYREIISRES